MFPLDETQFSESEFNSIIIYQIISITIFNKNLASSLSFVDQNDPCENKSLSSDFKWTSEILEISHKCELCENRFLLIVVPLTSLDISNYTLIIFIS